MVEPEGNDAPGRGGAADAAGDGSDAAHDSTAAPRDAADGAGGAALLDNIFDNIPAGIVCLDASLRILRVNAVGARAIGARADATGQTFAEAATAARPALAPALQSVLAGGQPLTFWGYPVQPTAEGAGDERDEAAPADASHGGGGAQNVSYWDYTLWPLERLRAGDAVARGGAAAADALDDPADQSGAGGPAGGRRGVLLFAVEVTDRVRAEQGMQDALGASQRAAWRLQGVVEQMGDGVVVSDREGRVVTINGAAVEMLGDAAALLASEFAPAAGLPPLRRADGSPFRPEEFPWRRAVAGGTASRGVEMIVPRGRGGETRLSVNASPLRDAAGEISGSVAVLRDTTETTRVIEELLEANRRLEEFNRLKAEFVANMSHELRTPLTAIIGFAQLMQMNIGGGPPLSKSQAEGVERILRNGRHLLSLIDDVLDLSKIEVGRISIHADYIDLVETVQSAFQELQSLARQKGLEYRLIVADQFPVAYADPVRIRQIVINLLSNAIKFTVRGRVEAEMTRHGADEWRLTVRDTGIGIRQDAVGLIFERFRQVDGSTTRSVGGVGLGLTIVQQIARLLDGTVEVESTYGRGSTFTVTLPLSSARSSAAAHARATAEGDDGGQEAGAGVAAAPSSSSAAGSAEAGCEGEDEGQPLVLVIEDDPDAASLLSETLASSGFRVRVAESGEAGLAMATECAPAAITLDIMMPKTDGWSVLQSIKSDARTAQIPVVICSIVDNRPLGFRLGASDYLVKPVSPERLIESLRGVGASPEDAEGYVLVVDDEQGFRALMAAALKDAGYRVRAAASGETALRLINQQPPRAVLCDLLMPNGMSGFELIARLRADERTAKLPVVAVTAKDVTPEDLGLVSGQIAEVIRKGDLLVADLRTRLRETLEEIGVSPAHG